MMISHEFVRRGQRTAKRAGDVLISLLALLLFSPFVVLFSILIRAEDGGPVIFRQSRRLMIRGSRRSVPSCAGSAWMKSPSFSIF